MLGQPTPRIKTRLATNQVRLRHHASHRRRGKGAENQRLECMLTWRQRAIDKERELERLRAERELTESVTEARITRATALAMEEAEESVHTPAQQRGKQTSKTVTGEERVLTSITATDLQRVAVSDAKLVVDLATKSKNLKGTFQHALKRTAMSLMEVVSVLANRQQSEEVSRLEKENSRLREMETLKVEVKAMKEFMQPDRRDRRRLSSLSPSPSGSLEEVLRDEATFRPPLPPQSRKTPMREDTYLEGADQEEARFERMMSRAMTQMGVMVAARFEAIEARFLPEKPLRPPLNVDRRAVELASVNGKPGPSGTQHQPAVSKANAKVMKKKGLVDGPLSARTPANDPPTKGVKAGKVKERKKGGGGDAVKPSSYRPAPLPAPLPADQAWTEVVKRGGKKKGKAAAGVTASTAIPASGIGDTAGGAPVLLLVRLPRMGGGRLRAGGEVHLLLSRKGNSLSPYGGGGSYPPSVW